MSRKPSVPKVTHPNRPLGATRTSGVLICDVCKFTVPYQGYVDPTWEDRPTHRCIEKTIRGFDTFDTNPPQMIRRQW